MIPAPRESLSVAEYGAELLRLVQPDRRSERVRLAEAGGRVLAGPVASRVSIPSFDNSAMDGYAVRRVDVLETPARLRVVGEVPAGSPEDPVAGPGECVRIMTGAALPGFADSVVPVENTDGGTDWVEIRVQPAVAAHVRRSGSDIAAGDVIAAAGDRLTPGLLGTLAGSGHTHADVRPRPVALVASTGDELVADGSPLARGQIHESNAVVLAAALVRDGAQALTGPPLRDDPEQLAEWLDRNSGLADFVILTGGASVGDYDVVRDVLVAHAGGTFRQVRMQPGKPQGWGLWPGGTPVIALPGNPISAALSYEVLVRPLLARLLGTPSARNLLAVAAAGWRSPAGRVQLQPVQLSSAEDGRLLATPAHRGGSASHLVTSLAHADAIAIVAEDVTDVVPGDLVTVRMFG
ncbi:MAG TPA: gephyrin-like molybdotransferase Glp [Propionicimonas sp.]|uniref:molybdopterin molybdotransferase MoeA n=1 Tax=Propionicimonas sp. TaxID=1955623 RepID=UPI002F3E73A0